jgi:hypothetical protein
MLKFIDYMLHNNHDLHLSLGLILIGSFILFVKINKINFFFFAVFLGIKFTVSSYVDNYIDTKRELKQFSEAHFTTVKFLTSLIITIPFLILSYLIGQHIPLSDE